MLSGLGTRTPVDGVVADVELSSDPFMPLPVIRFSNLKAEVLRFRRPISVHLCLLSGGTER